MPQEHVEKVCNELVGLGEEGFERELKSVIFSHVPEAQRLGQATLDDLVQFQAEEKQKRIDSLIRQLREGCRAQAYLQSQADPIVKNELLEKISRRELELEAHDKAKPEEKPNPSDSVNALSPDTVLLSELREAENAKQTLNDQIETVNEFLQSEERRLAVVKRLLEKLENFQKDFEVFKTSLEEDATEIGLPVNDLIALSINKTSAETIRSQTEKSLLDKKKFLDEIDPPGLRKRLASVEAKIIELQSKLDAPNRAYQTYLKELTEWQERRAKLEGSDDVPESLKGHKATLAALDQLPGKIGAVRVQQTELAINIHREKVAQAEIYRTLYGPVQQFIDSHEIAKDKLKLEFRAELVNDDFTTRLLELLALNRRGSFMGIDEGWARAEQLVGSTKWENADSVRSFLENVDMALHTDLREKSSSPVQLKDQLLKGKKPEEVYNLLYGLEYIRPRYILRWEGKDLSMLSPGERGTLLLVFYLLIDKGDIPLVMDQPEGNLDNHTVAKVLVECIKEARKRRQVFIVTHNPNLAIVCDADQIIHASMDKANGNAITYKSGSLENPDLSQYVTDVLEGTRWAFRVRDKKYEVSE